MIMFSFENKMIIKSCWLNITKSDLIDARQAC